MTPLPAPAPPAPSDAAAPVPSSTPQRTAALAALAGLMMSVAAQANDCPGYGCENWPKHDASASDYHYPPPPPPPPPDAGPGTSSGDSRMNPPGTRPKPSCDFCHTGLPVTRVALPVDNRYFPASLWQDPARFARVHQMAVSRTTDRQPYTRTKPVEQVPMDLQSLFRAIARR